MGISTARVAAAAFALGVSLAGPQALGVAVADSDESGTTSVSREAPDTAGPSRSATRKPRSAINTGAGTVGRGSAGVTPDAVELVPSAAAATPVPHRGPGSAAIPEPAGSIGDLDIPQNSTVVVAPAEVAAPPSLPHRGELAAVDPVPSLPAVAGPQPSAAAAPQTFSPQPSAAVAFAPVTLPKPASALPTLSFPALSIPSVAEAPAIAPILTALNTAVVNAFDQASHLLSTLPAPLSEFLQGGLLLIRRSLFNQAPTAKPVQYEQTLTDIVGGLNATDTEGEPIAYTVVSKPTYGDIKIDSATGKWTYTPPGFDHYGGTDSFTVKLTNPGSHLNLFGPDSTTVVVPVSIAGVDLLTKTTNQFQVWNRTSQTLYYRQQESGDVDSGPGTGSELKPGEDARFELVKYAFKTNDVRVSFSTSATAEPRYTDWFAVTLHAPAILDPTDVNSTFGCYSHGKADCKDYPGHWEQEPPLPVAIFKDPSGTVIDVGTDQKQRQADLMNKWCTNGIAKCDYTVTNITDLAPDLTTDKQVGSDAYNTTDGTPLKTLSYSFTETATTSWEISSEVSAAIEKIVTVKLAGKTGQSWTTSATASESLAQTLAPWSYTVVEAAPFLSDVRGDLKITMYNTTWNIKDVVFTYPTADKCTTKACVGSYVIQQAPLQGGFLIKDPNSATPYDPIYAVGDRKQLRVEAFSGSGKYEDYTTKANFTSSNPSVATVTGTGVVEAQAAGTTTITANYTWQINKIGPITVTKTMTVNVK